MVTDSEVDSRRAEMRRWYEGGYVFKCQLLQPKIEQHLRRSIAREGLADIRVESRTKSIDSLVDKASKLDPNGEFKYREPQVEITDLVGLRMLVPLSSDLDAAANVVRTTYDVVEENDRGEAEAQLGVPGYRSLHFLVRLNAVDRADPDFRQVSDVVVEVQVRTILQHAWASLQHDVMYKTERQPVPAIKSRLVALAGLLDLADQEFVRIRQAHAAVRDRPEETEEVRPGRLTASTLRHLAETWFAEEDAAAHDWFHALEQMCREVGLTTVAELERALGTWKARAVPVAEQVRRTIPWSNTAFLLDTLVRLALRERYFDRRPQFDADDEADEAMVTAARVQFLRELTDLESRLAPS